MKSIISPCFFLLYLSLCFLETQMVPMEPAVPLERSFFLQHASQIEHFKQTFPRKFSDHSGLATSHLAPWLWESNRHENPPIGWGFFVYMEVRNGFVTCQLGPNKLFPKVSPPPTSKSVVFVGTVMWYSMCPGFKVVTCSSWALK